MALASVCGCEATESPAQSHRTVGTERRPDDAPDRKRVAGIATVYRRQSHADVLLTRLVAGYALDGMKPFPALDLASVYVDQTPPIDLSRELATKHDFIAADSIEQALTLGTGKLAVDGVLLIGEHGEYPLSDTGQVVYPKRQMFEQVVGVFKESERVVPVFSDKHLADNWADADWIYRTAKEMNIPIMAGSSVPTYRRNPEADVRRDAPLEQIVGIGYGPVESYGFHALEMVQSLAERRRGGETGVRSVQLLRGPAVWKAANDHVYDSDLLEAAFARAVAQQPADDKWRQTVADPVLFAIVYNDGLKANVFLLDKTVEQFSSAWRYRNERNVTATRFAVQEKWPFMHFAQLLKGIEGMMQTGKPTWPVERTLLTSQVLHAAMISQQDAGGVVTSPYLNVHYKSQWDWQQPQGP